MNIKCYLHLDVELRSQQPIDTATQLRLQQTENFIKYYIHKRLKLIENEINLGLFKEEFLKRDDMVIISELIQEPPMTTKLKIEQQIKKWEKLRLKAHRKMEYFGVMICDEEIKKLNKELENVRNQT